MAFIFYRVQSPKPMEGRISDIGPRHHDDYFHR